MEAEGCHWRPKSRLMLPNILQASIPQAHAPQQDLGLGLASLPGHTAQLRQVPEVRDAVLGDGRLLVVQAPQWAVVGEVDALRTRSVITDLSS